MSLLEIVTLKNFKEKIEKLNKSSKLNYFRMKLVCSHHAHMHVSFMIYVTMSSELYIILSKEYINWVAWSAKYTPVPQSI